MVDAFWKYLWLDCSLAMLINGAILFGMCCICAIAISFSYIESLFTSTDFKENIKENLAIKLAKYFLPGIILCIVVAVIVGNIAKFNID